MLSLVTVCMNREAHLRQSLPHWLALPGLDEVVVVDWSTRECLDDLRARDDRIHLVRVINEPRWVLTYPYNLGIREARGDIIIKCDADCRPAAPVAGLTPGPGYFYAGDWRSGHGTGKACVNGQCVVTKAQWREVNGYSELLRRYGHDDGDFYERLVAAGHARREIDPAQLEFAVHDDAARVAQHAAPRADDVETFLHGQVHYHEAVNLVIAGLMPWGPWYPQAHYEVIDRAERLVVLRRETAREIPLSSPVQQIAHQQALRRITARVCRLAPTALARLDDEACRGLLARQLTRARAA